MTVIQVCRRTVILLTILFAPSLFTAALMADTPAPTGALWEVTSQMSMEGMPMQMPAQTSTVCTPRDWSQPPSSSNQGQECTTSDFVKDGNRITWKSVCDGQMPMTGTGEIILEGDDAYSGEVRYASDEGDMVINMNGHRIGDCDNPQ